MNAESGNMPKDEAQQNSRHILWDLLSIYSVVPL